MKIKVIMDGKKSTVDLDGGSKIYDMLNVSGIEENEVLTFREGKLIPLDEEMRDEDEIEVMRVVTGG